MPKAAFILKREDVAEYASTWTIFGPGPSHVLHKPHLSLLVFYIDSAKKVTQEPAKADNVLGCVLPDSHNFTSGPQENALVDVDGLGKTHCSYLAS